MENQHFEWVNPLQMVIFNSYFDITRGYWYLQVLRNWDKNCGWASEILRQLGCSKQVETPKKIMGYLPSINRHSISQPQYFFGDVSQNLRYLRSHGRSSMSSLSFTRFLSFQLGVSLKVIKEGNGKQTFYQ